MINIDLARQAGCVKQPVPVGRVVDWSFTEAELREAGLSLKQNSLRPRLL